MARRIGSDKTGQAVRSRARSASRPASGGPETPAFGPSGLSCGLSSRRSSRFSAGFCGKAADCKSAIPGSNPGGAFLKSVYEHADASTPLRPPARKIAKVARPFGWQSWNQASYSLSSWLRSCSPANRTVGCDSRAPPHLTVPLWAALAPHMSQPSSLASPVSRQKSDPLLVET